MGKIFIINDTNVTGGVASTHDIGTSTLTWRNGYFSGTITVGTMSISGLLTAGSLSVASTGVFGGSLTVGTGTIIAAKITATTGSFTALLTAGTASISGAIIGGTSVTAGTGSFSGNLFVGGTTSVGGAIIGATSLTVGTVSATGAVVGTSASILGTITAGTASLSGAIIATSGSVLETLTIGTASISGAVIADSGSIANLLTVGTVSASGDVRASAVVVATALASSTAAYPRTTRITSVDMLDIMNGAYVWPTGSSGTFNLIRHAPAVTAIDNSNPNLTVFQIAPSWSYDITQGWGLLPKSGLNFAPTLISNVNVASTDSIIFQAGNFQPNIQADVGPRTITNVFALAGDPRMNSSAGTITNMVCVRARGNTSSGSTVGTYTAFNNDFQCVSGSSVGTFQGLNISPTLSGSVGTFTGVKVTDSTAPTGPNVAFFHSGTSAHSKLQGYLIVGSTATPSHPLVVSSTRTETSGAISIAAISGVLNPGSDSVSTFFGLDNTYLTSASTVNPAATYIAGRYLVHRNSQDSGAITTMRGLQLQALNCAALGVGSGAVSTLEGVYFQAFDNSVTTTLTTTMRAARFQSLVSTSVVSARVITDMQAGYFDLNIAAASTGFTVTNGVGVFINLGSDALGRTGTYTNAYGLQIGNWNSTAGTGLGLTFTNPPEQIHLNAMTVPNSMGIRQVGGTAHNRLNGSTNIGSDAAPTNALSVIGSANISLTLTVGTVSATGAGIFGGALSFSTAATMIGERAYLTVDFTSAASTTYIATPFNGNIIDCYTTCGTTPRTCSGFTLRAGSAGTVYVATVSLAFNTAIGQQVKPTISPAAITTASAINITVTTAGTAANFSATIVLQRTA